MLGLVDKPEGRKHLQELDLEGNTTGWRMKCHTIDYARNTFLLLQKHLTSGTELILIGRKIVPNEEHVQCDHRFASQPLANELLHSSQLFGTSLQKARGTISLWALSCACAARFLKTCDNQWYDISCAILYIKISVKEVKWEDVDTFDRHQVSDNFRTVINILRKFMFYEITEISEQLGKS